MFGRKNRMIDQSEIIIREIHPQELNRLEDCLYAKEGLRTNFAKRD
jgi:hypothetical protein